MNDGFDGILRASRKAARMAVEVEELVRRLRADAKETRERVDLLTEQVRALQRASGLVDVPLPLRADVWTCTCIPFDPGGGEPLVCTCPAPAGDGV